MCTVTVDPILGRESVPGQGIDRITIQGSISQCAPGTGCSAVSVEVHQSDPVNVDLPIRQASVDAQGRWSVDFDAAQGDFAVGDFVCGDKNKCVVRAECVGAPQFSGRLASNVVICGGCPVLKPVIEGEAASDL